MVTILVLALISFILLMHAHVKLNIKFGKLKEKLDRHQVESFDSIKSINSYTGVGQKNYMPSPLALSINHMCDTEYKRLQSLFNRDN